jgi:OmpA family
MSKQDRWLFEPTFASSVNQLITSPSRVKLPSTFEWEAEPMLEFNKEWEEAPCGGIRYRKRPGKTKEGLVYTNAEGSDLRDVLLYDFDIDSYDLKPDHKNALNNLIKFMNDNFEERRKSGKNWTISLDGYASRTGAAEHNRILSECRTYSVRDYISAHLANPNSGLDLFPFVNFVHQQGHGFASTTVKGEDPLGRSVRVAVHRPEVLPPSITLPTEKSTRFRIRCLMLLPGGLPKNIREKVLDMLKTASFALGKYLIQKDLKIRIPLNLKKDFALFEIENLDNNISTLLCYTGVGMNIKILPIVKWFELASKSPGPFIEFKTNKPARFQDFLGPASIGSIFRKSEFFFKFNNARFRFKGTIQPDQPLIIPLGYSTGFELFSSSNGRLTICSQSVLMKSSTLRQKKFK